MEHLFWKQASQFCEMLSAMPAGRARRRRSTRARCSNRSRPGLQGRNDQHPSRLLPWAAIHQMPGASMTCPRPGPTTRFAGVLHRSWGLSAESQCEERARSMDLKPTPAIASHSTGTSAFASCAMIGRNPNQAKYWTVHTATTALRLFRRGLFFLLRSRLGFHGFVGA